MLRRLAVCVAVLQLMLITSVSSKSGYRKPMLRYPKDSQFWATDFFVRGCKNFLEKCPSAYKYQLICARNYNGDFRDFPNYCEMQYENCNTWLNDLKALLSTEYRIETQRCHNYWVDKADRERDDTFVELDSQCVPIGTSSRGKGVEAPTTYILASLYFSILMQL